VIQRGDIRWFKFSAPDKRRPVLVLGDASTLSHWSRIPVVPISTQARSLPWEIPLSPMDGLAAVSVLKPDWIQSVERKLLGPWIASLSEHRWPEVRAALLAAFGFVDP
jgi:mRNA interferase MazF